MHNHNKLLRVFRLIAILQTRPARTLRHISGALGISERSAYRYVDLLKELGFHVQTDNFKRIFIDSVQNTVPFTSDEARLLRDLVLTVGNRNKLRDSLLQKLYAHSDQRVQSELLQRAHLSKIVEDISRAMQEKRQVVLKKYMSAHSNDIRDRMVEPVKFTNGYERLVAYEPLSGQNKTFNLERITSVQVMKKGWKYEKEHRFTLPDVFGFHENGKSYEVNLLLTLRACVIFKEEYPAAAAHIKPVKGTKKFRFKAVVYDMKPVKRFVAGLPEEVEVC
jgi:proteasome accessory factor C